MVFFVGSISLVLGIAFTHAWFFSGPKNLFGEDSSYMKSQPWFPIAAVLFYGAILLGCFITLWKLLGVTTYDLSRQNLTLKKTLLFFSRTQNIPSGDIKKVIQIKDGGTGEDSFPSWGLNLYAKRKIKLLAKEPIDKSDWLGAELAGYYDIEFEPSKDRE